MTREAFYGDLLAWVQSEEGLRAPAEFFDEALRFVRDGGRLPVDVTPANLRVVALAAAVQGCQIKGGIDPNFPHYDPVRHTYWRKGKKRRPPEDPAPNRNPSGAEQGRVAGGDLIIMR